MIKEPRTKLVNFRLSEEEYAKLLSTMHSNNHSARSVSDFCRVAVLERLNKQPGPDPITIKLNDLEARVSHIEQKYWH